MVKYGNQTCPKFNLIFIIYIKAMVTIMHTQRYGDLY